MEHRGIIVVIEGCIAAAISEFDTTIQKWSRMAIKSSRRQADLELR